jgi:hypothetical protein
MGFRAGVSDAFLGWDPVKPEVLFVRHTYTDWILFRVDTPRGKQQILGFVPGGTREAYYDRRGKCFVFEVSGPSELYSVLVQRELEAGALGYSVIKQHGGMESPFLDSLVIKERPAVSPKALWCCHHPQFLSYEVRASH